MEGGERGEARDVRRSAARARRRLRRLNLPRRGAPRAAAHFASVAFKTLFFLNAWTGNAWTGRGNGATVVAMASVLVATLAMNPTAKVSLSGGPWGTSRHHVEFELFLDQMPITVSNFIDLARRGFFDGQHFHKLVPGEFLFGGCPFSKEPGHPRLGTGTPPPHSTFKNLGSCTKETMCPKLARDGNGTLQFGDEILPRSPSNSAGSIAMGRAAKRGTDLPTREPREPLRSPRECEGWCPMQVLPETDGVWGSLFFVNLKSHPALDGAFPVFGRLKQPTQIQLLEQIGAAPADGAARADAPPVKLEAVVIEFPKALPNCEVRRRLADSRDPVVVARSPQGGAYETARSWQAEWLRRLECWWLRTPHRAALQACLGSLGVALAQSFDRYLGRAHGVHTAVAQGDCESLLGGSEIRSQLELPQFPSATFNWVVPPLPRLLPSLERLQWLQGAARERGGHVYRPAPVSGNDGNGKDSSNGKDLSDGDGQPQHHQIGLAAVGVGMGLGATIGLMLVLAFPSVLRPGTTSRSRRRYSRDP